MQIVVLDDYQDAFRSLACSRLLKDHDVRVFHDAAEGAEALIAMLHDAEAVILLQQRTSMPRHVVECLPKLRLISQTGHNAAHIDLVACRERGIVVSMGGAGGANATAELAWGLILSAARHIPQEVQALKQGRWQTTMGSVLAGRSLGIYAYGRIGSLVARVGRAFGMNVVCWGREGSLAKARQAGYESAQSRVAFFSECDVVSLHIPFNQETAGIITSADLALMKPEAILVNTSRSGIIVPGALEAALKFGRPGRAGVDVYETEPVLRGEHPLLKLDNVICTPHLGYVEMEAYEALYSAAVEQVLAFAAGRPINVVGS